MPVYLVHGFRWPRDGFTGIRVHAIVHNLEDTSVEYIQNENSKRDLLRSFRDTVPNAMKELEAHGHTLDFIEQYDPDDVDSATAVSQPFAYVADKVVAIAEKQIGTEWSSTGSKGKGTTPASSPLSLNVEEVIASGTGLPSQAWEALADLRDKVAEGEKIGWWVVYNGDPMRSIDSSDDGYEDNDEVSTPTASTSQAIAITEDVVAPPVPPKSPITSEVATIPIREKPVVTLPAPKEDIPEPPRLKDMAKTTGFRRKFFGKKS